MSLERQEPAGWRKPYEVFGLNEKEVLYWRVNQARFEHILNDKETIIHRLTESNNSFGEFLFVTTSRPGERGRICITFYGLGYHEHRERWITKEWFWYQANPFPDLLQEKVKKEEAADQLQKRRESIEPEIGLRAQSERGKLFEILADLTDDDGALAEMQDLEYLSSFLNREPFEESEAIPPTGENLLDQASREKLPPLYSGEEQGLEATAQVKFFTPDGNWTWYASEFDGEDIFFGLVSGFDIELGYFSLSELKEAKGPLGLLIERDLYFESRTLRELKEQHLRARE